MCESPLPISMYRAVGPFFQGLAVALRADGARVVVNEALEEVCAVSGATEPPASPESRARLEMVRVARLLYERDYNVTIDGNLSMRIGPGRFLLTPSGRHNGFLNPEDLIVVDDSGLPVNDSRKASSEYRLHAFIYRRRSDIHAVIHVHSPYATAATLAGIDLWQTWVTMAPVPTTEYARIASEKSPQVIEPFVEDYNWAILPRHGAVAWADTLWNAFLRIEGLEHLAKIVMIAHATGKIRPMSAEQRAELLKFWKLELKEF